MQRHSAISISQNYTVTAKTSGSTQSQTYRPTQRKSKQSVYSCSLVVTLNHTATYFSSTEQGPRRYHRRTPADHWCGAAPRRAGHQRISVPGSGLVVHSTVNRGGGRGAVSIEVGCKPRISYFPSNVKAIYIYNGRHRSSENLL